jgi:hypothetical protein
MAIGRNAPHKIYPHKEISHGNSARKLRTWRFPHRKFRTRKFRTCTIPHGNPHIRVVCKLQSTLDLVTPQGGVNIYTFTTHPCVVVLTGKFSKGLTKSRVDCIAIKLPEFQYNRVYWNDWQNSMWNRFNNHDFIEIQATFIALQMCGKNPTKNRARCIPLLLLKKFRRLS